MQRWSLIAWLALLLFGCPAREDETVDWGVEPDTAATDLTAALEEAGAKTCGPGIYPCGPYGTKLNEIAPNMTFLGFMDPKTHCKAGQDWVMDSSQLVKISFQDWYLGDTSPACAKYRKKLLWVTSSAGWCNPCKIEVAAIQSQYSAGTVDPRLAFVDIIFETDQPVAPANESTIKWWINLPTTLPAPYTAPSLTFPVAMDPSFKMGAFFSKQAVPFNMLIDTSTMKIFYRQTGGSLTDVGKKVDEFFNK